MIFNAREMAENNASDDSGIGEGRVGLSGIC